MADTGRGPCDDYSLVQKVIFKHLLLSVNILMVMLLLVVHLLLAEAGRAVDLAHLLIIVILLRVL